LKNRCAARVGGIGVIRLLTERRDPRRPHIGRILSQVTGPACRRTPASFDSLLISTVRSKYMSGEMDTDDFDMCESWLLRFLR
jgi:hypothetical protein